MTPPAPADSFGGTGAGRPSRSIALPRLAPPPGRREFALFGLLVAGLLAVLLLVDARGGGEAPAAFVISILLVYGLLCLVRLETAFAILLAVTPFSIEMAFRGSGSALQIPTEPMLFVALAAWGFRFLARRSTTFAHPVLTAAAALAILACLASLHDTTYRMTGLKATVNGLWYALYGMFVWNNFDRRDRLKGMIAAWLVPGLLVCLYSLVRVAAGDYVPQAGYWSADPFFNEHGTFAAYLSFVCMLSLALALELRGAAKLFFSIAALLTGGQIVLSLTRGAWIGMGVGLLFLLVVSGRRLRQAGNVGLGIFGVSTLVAVVLLSGALVGIEKQTRNITRSDYTSNLERLNRWYAGWNMFLSDPVTGVGFGTYTDNYLQHRRFPLGTDQSDMNMGVHSEYLKVLAETGLVGVAAAALALLAVGFVARRAIVSTAGDPLLRGLAVGLAGGLLTYLVHGTVNNYMVYDKAAIPVWTAVGLLGAIATLKKPR